MEPVKSNFGIKTLYTIIGDFTHFKAKDFSYVCTMIKSLTLSIQKIVSCPITCPGFTLDILIDSTKLYVYTYQAHSSDTNFIFY